MPGDLKLVVELAVGLAVPLGTFVFGLWRWDVSRLERRAKEREAELRAQAETDRRQSDERAKEREHELKLAKLAAETEHQEDVKTLRAQVIHLQQVVEERLFKALDDSRVAKTDLTDAHDRLIRAVQTANRTELEAIRALSDDVAALKTELPNQYAGILTQMGEVLDQSRQMHLTLGDLVGKVAEYHASVETALLTQDPPPTAEEETSAVQVRSPPAAG